MDSGEKIEALIKLEQYIRSLITEDHPILHDAANKNPWFTSSFIKESLKGISRYLRPDDLNNWISHYHFNEEPKKVGLVMAGNIPLVGFHDLLCVLCSSHQAFIKLSHQDDILLPHLIRQLFRFDKRFGNRIHFVQNMDDIDAIIATGSDNTARYLRTQFIKIPHIIRKNRTSIAVLTGEESEIELQSLAHDVFLYFGLGCRNVSKIFFPNSFKPEALIRSFTEYRWFLSHQKYSNNLKYQRSTMNINDISFIDGDFFIFKEAEQMVSPVSVIYYELFDEIKQVKERILLNQDKIQCVVAGKNFGIKNQVKFGLAQFPDIWDYADQIDTMAFLEELTY